MNTTARRRVLLWTLCCGLLLPATRSLAGNYTNFEVAVYATVNTVRGFENLSNLQMAWDRISSQLKVDKVYIEVQRDRTVASDEVIEKAKKFFLDRGVKVAGGMCLSDGSIGGQFKSFCYTDPADRAFIKQTAELAAKHFDEVIQDDFFFVTTKTDSDIAAKGSRTWTQFRLDLMDDAAENLLVKPAHAVNPNVKMIVKYPNWYEHFQGLGFDLDKGPKIFDGIYAGTETRDPEITDQNLQQYESYQIIRYFENIKPGGNGGGWVDTFDTRYVDRYAEQLWNTAFAKAPQITLFEWSAMTRPINRGDRSKWQDLSTSFNYNDMLKYSPTTNDASANASYARVAGYSLSQVDAFLGKLGKPIGVQCYKPYQSTGEDFLHNYLGNLGIPIDLHPEFPTNANLVLLTESAVFDPDIVSKIKAQLVAGKSVVITSGLFHALQGKGIEDIVEAKYTSRKLLAHDYWTGFGAGQGVMVTNQQDGDVLFPELEFFTNDSWTLVRAQAAGKGYPLMFMDRYSKGILYIWAIPENVNDLYRLPAAVMSTVKDYVMAGFPMRLDGPGQVALFAYDNNSFIVESYRAEETDVRVSVTGNAGHLHNLVTGETVNPAPRAGFRGRGRGNTAEPRVAYNLHLSPHSYSVFAVEP